MNWLILILAGLLEICWSVGMKYSCGFTKLFPAIFTLITMIGSFVLLGITLKTLPLGTAYAVWTGIGTIGAALAGMILFAEQISVLRIICILLIVCGIAGLKVLSHN